MCRWAELCAIRRREDDHLSLVAGITARQRKALAARELDTVVRLAAAPIPFDPPLDGASAASVERVREQARIQVEGRGLPKPIHELLLPIDAERGLATLPEPDPGDLFLDLEGDPYAFDDGVDYLFGVMDTQDEFRAFWSFDPDGSGDVSLAGEKLAFEQLMDFLTDRLERYPEMHVYHYASYEPTALKRLMGRHGTREEQVDRLLRGGVLVDLFRAVRQGLRASVESYSIKKIEALYDFTRQEGLRDAGSSIVEFEEWLQLGETDRPVVDHPRLDRDVQPRRRAEHAASPGLARGPAAETCRCNRPGGSEAGSPLAGRAGAAPRGGCACAGGRHAADRTASRTTRWSVRHSSRHRGCLHSSCRGIGARQRWRSGTSSTGIGMDVAELAADKQALGPLEVIGPIGEPWKPSAKAKYARQTWRYRFAPQDYDIGSDLYDPAPLPAAARREVERVEGARGGLRRR